MLENKNRVLEEPTSHKEITKQFEFNAKTLAGLKDHGTFAATQEPAKKETSTLSQEKTVKNEPEQKSTLRYGDKH
jgi:hypothetical protein